jgi:hypothetical protein
VTQMEDMRNACIVLFENLKGPHRDPGVDRAVPK